jgi:multicomponent Na+:H+ antiporter subunit G
MMAGLLDFLSWICLLGGAFFVLTGAIGILRLPDFFTRLHALGVCDTMGVGLTLLGLMLQSGLNLVTVKILLIFYFVVFTGPTATHALAVAALAGGYEPVVDDTEPQQSNT